MRETSGPVDDVRETEERGEEKRLDSGSAAGSGTRCSVSVSGRGPGLQEEAQGELQAAAIRGQQLQPRKEGGGDWERGLRRKRCSDALMLFAEP